MNILRKNNYNIHNYRSTANSPVICLNEFLLPLLEQLMLTSKSYCICISLGVFEYVIIL